MSTAGGTVLPGSFRDPSGFVFRLDGELYRQVNEAHREAFDRFTASGLYGSLVEEGLLVRHEEVDPALAPLPGGYKVLRPEPVPFVSYPYEWCFSELRDAALVTLRAQELAMEHGMTLRDASAYNVQFRGTRPVLIDTLSFGPLVEGEPWVGYRQFCQHFLAPLALMRYGDVRLGRLSQVHVDGIPLDLAAALLPTRALLRPSLLVHLTLHARSQRKHAGRVADVEEARRRASRRFDLRAFRALVQSLRSAVERLEPPSTGSTWSGYYEQADHYGPQAFERKRELVERFIERLAPRMVWDLGANVGAFSRLSSRRGIPTVAFDMDHGCVEEAYRRARAGHEGDLLPLVLDLTEPSPGIGWGNEERMTLEERGPADLVLALALVHHLAIANNVPLPMIAEYLARLARWLVIEFVPKDDPRVGQLLASREDVFASYDREHFEAAMAERFDIEQVEPLPGSTRLLCLLRRR